MSSTLTPEGCAARRDRLWQWQPEPCDVLVITAPESLVYLANYAPSPFVFNSVEAAAALVLWPDCSILIGDNLLQPFLERSCVDEVVDLDWHTGENPPRRGGSGSRRESPSSFRYGQPIGSVSSRWASARWPRAGCASSIR